MLNEYAKVFEVYNETMAKDYHFGKINEYASHQLNGESKQNDNDATKKFIKNSNTTKCADECNNSKQYSKVIPVKVSTEPKCYIEKNSMSNNSNNTNVNEHTSTNSSVVPCNYHEIPTKKKEEEHNKNNKKYNNNNNNVHDLKHSKNKDNKNHISICKICYLQKVQAEVEQLKARKERTTVYPREFNDYMQYETILEIILAKKHKKGKPIKG